MTITRRHISLALGMATAVGLTAGALIASTRSTEPESPPAVIGTEGSAASISESR